MYGLPQATEVYKQLPKARIYDKFALKYTEQESFDRDISKIYITNIISTETVNLTQGKDIGFFYVLTVQLKNKEFDKKNIEMISKLIPQKMLFILQYENQAKMAVFHMKLLQSEWKDIDSIMIEIKGLNLGEVWENIIVQVGNIDMQGENTLDEQIVQDGKQLQIQKRIDQLEAQARRENNPRKKFDLVQEIKKIRNS